MVYRVYRVYGYFQKSIYGIYFTFPTTRSGGWESDRLYRVIETRKKPDLTTHRPPPVRRGVGASLFVNGFCTATRHPMGSPPMLMA